MRLTELEIHGFRAFPPEEQPPLEFGAGNGVIVGDNGTGKSSVLAAIEFLLTGGMAHLEGEGTGDIDVRSYAPHIDANTDQSYVRGRFISSDDREGFFERRVSDHRNLQSLEGEIDSHEIEVSQWNSNHLILTRRRLLNFIEATSRSRGTEFSKLLNLRGVTNRAQGFRWIRGEISREVNECREACDRYLADIGSSLDIDVPYPMSDAAFSNILDQVNSRLETLGVDSVDDLDEIEEALDSIQFEIDSEAVDPFYQSSTRERISRVSEWIDETAEVIDATLTELAEDLAELEAIESVSLEKLDLFEAAETLVTEHTTICPLCGVEHDEGELHEIVENEQDDIQDFRELRERVRTNRSELRGLISSHLDELQELITDLTRGIEEGDHLEAREDLRNVRDYEESLIWLVDRLESDLVEQLDDGTIEIEQISVEDLTLEWDSPENHLTSISEYANELPPLEDHFQGYSDLDRVREAWESYNDEVDSLHELERIEEECERVVDLFDEASQEVMDDLIDEIQGDFNEYYSSIHPDERDIDLEFDANGTESVDLEASFETTRDNPLAYHSEGHLDTMGVCLFLALRDHLDESGPNIVMLDDIVMSVDRAHRGALANLLSEYLDDLQGIITTHEEVWADQLFESGVVNRNNRFEISDWDVSVGPILSGREGNPVWELAREYLDDNKPHVAAAHLRRQSEKICRQAAASLAPDIRYQESYSLGNYIYALNSHISPICTAAKREQDDDSEIWQSAQVLDTQRSDLIGNPPRDELNRMTHYNRDEWGQLSAGDLRPIVDHWEEVENLFQCDSCGGLIYTDEQDGWTWIQCSCREIEIGTSWEDSEE